MQTIYLTNSKYIKMPILPDKIEVKSVDKKQWTFIGSYDLRELRDIFLVIREYNFLDKKEVYQKIRELIKKTNLNKAWQNQDSRERDILEYQNTLENLNLISYDKGNKRFTIKNYEVFKCSRINEKLNIQDKSDFKIIFLNFLRFKEALNWFSKDFSFDKENLIREVVEEFDYPRLVTNSIPLYSFNRNSSKSVDSILYKLEDNANIYTIENSNKNFIRFWNVFTTIGEELNIINSFRHPIQVYVSNNKTLDYHYRAIRYNYVVNEQIEFNIQDYLLQNKTRERTIRIPDLIKELVIKYSYPIDLIREEIINQCYDNKDLCSLQRTSFAFIEKNELKFFPINSNGYYLSHILLRK